MNDNTKTVKLGRTITVTGDANEIDELIYKDKGTQRIIVVDDADFKKVVKRVLELNNRFIPTNLSFDEKVKWTKQFILCMQSELTELLDSLPWKHWKNYDNMEHDGEQTEFEIADLFIFLIGIAGIWDMGAEDIIKRIDQKMDVNFNRQERGY